MGLANDFLEWAKKTFTVLLRKIGTFLLFVFVLGSLFGYVVATQKDPTYLALPVISMFVMYYDLDWGVLAFVASLILVFAF